MTASVYTLRIRETPDDEAGNEVRIVASSLTEAVARAELRFGPGRIAGIEQEDPVPLDAAPDAQTVHVAAETAVAAVAQAEGFDAPATHAPYAAAPFLGGDPDDRRWLPTALLWGGIGVGVLGFVLWLNFGSPARDHFVTAKTAPAPTPTGLALGGDAPPGGVLDAVGVDLRSGGSDVDAFGELVQQGVAVIDPADGNGSGVGYGDAQPGEGDAAIAPETVRSIGTLVGELFSRAPEPPPPAATPDEAYANDAYAEQAPTAPLPTAPELQRWYVEVQRADRVTETLAVRAYDAEQARRIIYDRPDHPVIVRGPALELTW